MKQKDNKQNQTIVSSHSYDAFIQSIKKKVIELKEPGHSMANTSFNEPSISYGTLDDNNILYIIEMVRLGIDFPYFDTIVDDSPFAMNEWSDFLHLSERTMQRYKKEQTTFDPIHSEKILQIVLCNKYGADVFGNKEMFHSWLNTKNIALGNIKPKELLDNSFGIELIKDELTRIDHGVLA